MLIIFRKGEYTNRIRNDDKNFEKRSWTNLGWKCYVQNHAKFMILWGFFFYSYNLRMKINSFCGDEDSASICGVEWKYERYSELDFDTRKLNWSIMNGIIITINYQKNTDLVVKDIVSTDQNIHHFWLRHLFFPAKVTELNFPMSSGTMVFMATFKYFWHMFTTLITKRSKFWN